MYCEKCGKEIADNAIMCPQCGAKPNTSGKMHADNGNPASFFDGGLLSYLGWLFLGSLITTVTLGICFPWAICMVYGWKINHTVIEGRRLKFNGSAVSLFGNWILWLLLIIITLGIYSFWVGISLEKWKVKNTTFAD
jgi:uncharacterized membrane protein YjgN (DUF898 family)